MILIGRILAGPARIADVDRDNAGDMLNVMFCRPEAAPGRAMAVVAAKRERDMSDSNAAGTAYNLDTIAAELGFTEYGQFYPG